MTQTQQEWKADALGRWTGEQQHEITAEQTVAYAKATNSQIADQLSGQVAPPVYAIVPPFPQLGEAMAGMVPMEVLMRVVHGEQDMRFHQPITPGMTLKTRAAVAGVRQARSGVTVHIRVQTTTADGEPVNDQSMVAFFRGATGAPDVGEPAPPHRTGENERSAEPVAVVEQTFDADQTFRYADASGDHMPIHKDEEFAKKVGLPGIIIHGLCTMAFNANAIVERCCGGDTTKLKRLAVRFSAPNLPGQTMTTTIWEADEAPEGRRAFAFQATNDAGATVIKDGWAEVDAA